jgi:uncharacterized caspase-like protein
VDGRRLALVVATSDYQDTELRRLRAPAQDAAELVEVLGAEAIGGFTVTSVLDGTERDVRIAVESFLTGCGPDDFALVYMSCHGLLDARGQLWFAASDTLKNLLGSTAVGASWLRERLENCRATRQLVLLDCCFSGAYANRKGAAEVGVETLHGGRGSVVLTASRATEYSYEGEPVDGGALAGSVFTTALVHGLRTGEADLDNDGVITTDEAYEYVYDYLRALGANQTPTHNAVGGVGRIQLARSPVGVRPVVVPAQSTIRAVAEAAEIMAVVPAPVASGFVSPAIDGPAAELATLRAVRRVIDDPAALETVLRERTVPDVVKVIAAVHASGLADHAADVLRVAAAVRPVDEIVALVATARIRPTPPCSWPPSAPAASSPTWSACAPTPRDPTTTSTPCWAGRPAPDRSRRSARWPGCSRRSGANTCSASSARSAAARRSPNCSPARRKRPCRPCSTASSAGPRPRSESWSRRCGSPATT